MSESHESSFNKKQALPWLYLCSRTISSFPTVFLSIILARRLAQFVSLLNQEEVNYRADSLREVAAKNRNSYRRLRKELEDLTDHGMLMLKSLQRPEANVMQRLAVQVLCKQLDQAWTYFSRSWKMQDHVYVQYLELNTFQVGGTSRDVTKCIHACLA